MLARTQRVLIVSPDSHYLHQLGAITDVFPRSHTYLIRLDSTGAAIAFGFSEVVCAPSGNRKGISHGTA